MTARPKFAMTPEALAEFRGLSQVCGIREACTRMKTTPYTAKIEAEKVGCLEEFCALFPRVRNVSTEPVQAILPRDLDPAVKWLTREWRRAA